MSDVAIDSSAIIAVLEGEPEGEAILRVIEAAGRRLVGAGTMLEASIVVARRRGEAGLVALDALSARLAFDLVPMGSEHVSLARDAWLRFGKGRHVAGLNLGDCMSYAVASASGVPLLCKGEDFPNTDLNRVHLG